MRASVPSGASTGKISVSNAAGSAASADDFAVSSGESTVSFVTTDDSYVRSSRPEENNGRNDLLKARKSSSDRVV